MPANLTPDYFKAEQWYRQATTNEEKILALEQMLAVMPKHKGTDHLKADLRHKLSKLKEVSTQKGHGKHADIFYIPRTGSGQVALIGTPNCGKSSIVAALTNANVNVADFPFATSGPVPGMLKFEDVQIQIIDMPPITADYSAPGQIGTYRHCNLIAIVIDLSTNTQEQIRICLDFLESRSLLIDTEKPAINQQGSFLGKKAFSICTKSDIAVAGSFTKLIKSCKYPFKFIEVSSKTGAGFGELPAVIYSQLGIIRIYAKPPGKPPDMNEPFTMPVGSNVQDLANSIHRQLAEKLLSARIWGTDVYKGQNVQLNHILHDKDIVELHFG